MLKLPGHDRFPYSGIVDRPSFTWPGGKRLAVYIAVCVEHFNYGEGGLGLSYSPGLDHPNTYNWAWREYGNRVGGYRLAEMAEELGVPLTLLVNAACYEHCPELIAAMKGRKGEIVAHGLTNSRHPNAMSEEEERSTIEAVTAAIREHEGSPPAGWMSPGANPSRRTEDLLQEAGYQYTMDWPMDDQPVWMRAGPQNKPGHLLAMPYPHEVNDVPMITMHHGTSTAFAEMVMDNFDELLDASSKQSLVYGITLHTFIVGQPFRLKQFRAALEHMNSRSDEVWFTTAGAVAQHYAKKFPAPK